MNQKLNQTIKQNTISLKEFAEGFTPEQKQVADNELRYYDILITLKQVRKEIGLTQQELADRANLPRTTITKIESGRYNPTLNTLMTVTSAMNKTLEVNIV